MNGDFNCVLVAVELETQGGILKNLQKLNKLIEFHLFQDLHLLDLNACDDSLELAIIDRRNLELLSGLCSSQLCNVPIIVISDQLLEVKNNLITFSTIDGIILEVVRVLNLDFAPQM